jgi:hypothetical protein
MINSGALQSEESENLAADLAELQAFGKEIEDAVATQMTGALKDRIAKWISKVREVARVYKAIDYTITLGVPVGVSVSFTWSEGSKNGRAPERHR